MSWGSEWGALWGGSPGEYLPNLFTDRLLMFVRNTNAMGIVHALGARTDELLAELQSIPASFSITDGAGEQLGRLGAILQRPRYGSSDTDYRILLQIQAQIILSSAGTTPVLLEVVRLFTGLDAPHYYETHPAHIAIGAVVSPARLGQLRRILTEAKPGGVRLDLSVYPEEQTLLCDTVGEDVTDPGTVDTVSGSEGAAAYPTALVVSL